MKLDRFTEKAQEALQEAAELARETGNQAVEPEHLLLSLVRQDEGVARTILERTGATVQALQPALVSAIERFPKVSGGAQPYLSEALSKNLDQAMANVAYGTHGHPANQLETLIKDRMVVRSLRERISFGGTIIRIRSGQGVLIRSKSGFLLAGSEPYQSVHWPRPALTPA